MEIRVSRFECSDVIEQLWSSVMEFSYGERDLNLYTLGRQV
jgi:hypothetical protein